jgi:hypothetical protein
MTDAAGVVPVQSRPTAWAGEVQRMKKPCQGETKSCRDLTGLESFCVRFPSLRLDG